LANSLSIIAPALNEERNIVASVEALVRMLETTIPDYEILIFNDGSTDGTGRLAEQLAERFSKIIVIAHERPKGLGGCYKEGILKASKEFVIMFPVNNECDFGSVKSILLLAGSTDIVVPYVENQSDRPHLRKVASEAFTNIMSLVSGVRLRYFNGTVLHRTALIRSVEISTDSYAYQCEALIKLIYQGKSFSEIGIHVNYRPHRTKAFRIGNIISVLGFIAKMGFWCLGNRRKPQ